jgi:hypothetical protein
MPMHQIQNDLQLSILTDQQFHNLVDQYHNIMSIFKTVYFPQKATTGVLPVMSYKWINRASLQFHE